MQAQKHSLMQWPAMQQHWAQLVAIAASYLHSSGLIIACTVFKVPRDDLEPNQDPWPAGGFPGPPKSRPLTTIAQLLTWTPPTAVDITNSSLEGEPRGPLLQQHATGQVAGSTVLQSTRATQGQLPDPCSSNTPLVLPQPGIRGAGSAGTSHGAADCPAGRPQLLVCHDMMGGYHPQETLLSGFDDHRCGLLPAKAACFT